MKALSLLLLAAGAALALYGYTTPAITTPPPRFSAEEIAMAAALRLPDDPVVPGDPSNRVADSPQAAALGHRLFFDTRLSANGQIACATCHQPERAFTDGLAKSKGLGETKRNAPSVVGSAFGQWFFWDGRRDSQWAQALGPTLDAAEHGLTRNGFARRIQAFHRAAYDALFGPIPNLDNPRRFPDRAGPEGDASAARAWAKMDARDRVAVNTVLANGAKAIAAYERLLVPGPSRFDRFAAALSSGQAEIARRLLSADELQGFRLFVGSGRCTQCHNGPMFSNYQFHNTGLHLPVEPEHQGRRPGLEQALRDDFNCLGEYSDDRERCTLRYVGNPLNSPIGAFKTPSLRNVALTAPYMRTGEFATLEAVLEHYNSAGREPGAGGNELSFLTFDKTEIRQLEAFLRSLSGGVSASPEWLKAP